MPSTTLFATHIAGSVKRGSRSEAADAADVLRWLSLGMRRRSHAAQSCIGQHLGTGHVYSRKLRSTNRDCRLPRGTSSMKLGVFTPLLLHLPLLSKLSVLGIDSCD